MVDDLSALGQFDVVLFLGVLYHMEEPLRAMKQVASFVAPGGMAVVETEAVEIPGLENVAVCEFFPGRELNNDPTNWWSPNSKALEGLCSAAGLPRFSMVIEPPRTPWRRLHKRLAAAVKHLLKGTRVPANMGMGASGKGELPRLRYRAIAHAAR